MLIDLELASKVEATFKRYLPSILDQMGLGLKAVSIGGKFNEDGILLEVGLVDKKASAEDSMRFTINQQNDGHELEYIEPENSYKRLIKLTGLQVEQIRKFERAARKLGHKANCGDVYKKNDAKYVCVGYNKGRGAFVMASLVSGDCKYLPTDKIANFKRLKEKFDLS